jgi:hypothetical protein
MDNSRMTNELMHIDGDTLRAVQQARQAAMEEAAQGIRRYDSPVAQAPMTQVDPREAQMQALGRFLDSPNAPDVYDQDTKNLFAALKQNKQPVPERVVPDDYVNYFQF